MEIPCKSCSFLINPVYYFCPNCGKKFREPPFKFSIPKAMWIILLSVLMPPYGFFAGARYFMKDETSAKLLGITAIMITFIMIVLLLIVTKESINKVTESYKQIQQLQQLNSSFQSYPGGLNQEQILNRIESQGNSYDQILLQGY